MRPNPQETTDLVTFTEEILNGKLHFLCSVAFVIGDSMVKDIGGYLLTGSMKRKFILKKQPFSSAKTVDIQYYIKPTKRYFDPSLYILHIGY